MKWHPAISMIAIWSIGVAAFVILPFKLETRTVETSAFMLLAAFVATFVIGAFTVSPILKKRSAPFSRLLDFTLLDRLLIVTGSIAIAMQLADILQGNVLNLDAAFADRDARAVGVLQGRDTGGSLLFQIGFMFYPAGFIAIARELLFRRHFNYVRLLYTGLAPVVLAAVSMGGRGPILYAIALGVLCLYHRKSLFPPERIKKSSVRSVYRMASIFGGILVVGIAMNYFVDVFIARANVAGGVEAMAKISALTWGVSFDGPGSEFLRNTIGAGNTYLMYAFIWYMVQGIVMSNVIFSHYDAGMTFGVYGLDLGSAIVRRISPDFVANSFAPLLDLNVYGFLPSAFGSLFVDLWYFAFLAVFAWGMAAGYVYRRFHMSPDARWVLVSPFVSLGIFFSLINTPLGFGNGLMIHLWLVAALFLIKPVTTRAAHSK